MDAPRVVGVAGGVGTTTLTTALSAHDGEREIEPSVDVLACRYTADSLDRAAELLTELSEAGWPQPVVAVTTLVPGPPRGLLRARLRTIEQQVGGLVMLPYVARWRDMSNPLPQAAGVLDVGPDELPRELRDYALAVGELVDAIVDAGGNGARSGGRHLTRLLVAGTVAVSTPLAIAGAAAAAPDGDWDKLSQCESSGKWNTSTGNGFYGGLQFTQSTWNAYGGKGNPATASREEQIAVAERTLAGQGWGAWPACSRKLGLNSAPTPRSGPSPAAPSPATPAPAIPAPAQPRRAQPAPTIPAPTIPAPAIPTPNIPSPDIPTPAIPSLDIPSPDIPTPKMPKSTIPAPNIPTPAIPKTTKSKTTKTATTKPKATKTTPGRAVPAQPVGDLTANLNMSNLKVSLSKIADQLDIQVDIQGELQAIYHGNSAALASIPDSLQISQQLSLD